MGYRTTLAKARRDGTNPGYLSVFDELPWHHLNTVAQNLGEADQVF